MKNHPMKNYLIATSLLAAVGFAGTSHAIDGVFEISESCATSFGCFDGDSAGFPVTITESGSYRLTSNLTTGSANTTLINVNADNVSIDLNGYSLIGPVSCTGNGPTCSASGDGDGINASGDNQLQVRNGFISGMGDFGISGGADVTVQQVTVTNNASTGISLGDGLVKDCLVADNGGFGIAMNGLVIDNRVDNNGNAGLFGFGTGVTYGNNLFTSNNPGSSQVSGGVQISQNMCGTSLISVTPCP